MLSKDLLISAFIKSAFSFPKDINFDELNHLIFQVEITYKKKNGGKYIRVITKKLKVSDDKEKINKQANFDIISTLQIQKSAKLAGKGDTMQAQAQIHAARNYLNQQVAYNHNNYQIYNQFNMNMNSFNNNLGMNNMMNMNQGMNMGMMNMNPGMNIGMMNMNPGMMNMNPGMMNMNHGMNNMMNNNDMLSAQIHQFANTSQNRQCMMFNRLNQK